MFGGMGPFPGNIYYGSTTQMSYGPVLGPGNFARSAGPSFVARRPQPYLGGGEGKYYTGKGNAYIN
ncbi:unnamed protein product [Enterobius vermicularis]|uniref:Uncharacterized protein n=1 Tax=Enterobius vermicularis TaxID=51028 RepID=A0A0N4VHC9_ENTVE|nr:unnamed protein product [Enterobius vermicularis]